MHEAIGAHHLQLRMLTFWQNGDVNFHFLLGTCVLFGNSVTKINKWIIQSSHSDITRYTPEYITSRLLTFYTSTVDKLIIFARGLILNFIYFPVKKSQMKAGQCFFAGIMGDFWPRVTYIFPQQVAVASVCLHMAAEVGLWRIDQ